MQLRGFKRKECGHELSHLVCSWLDIEMNELSSLNYVHDQLAPFKDVCRCDTGKIPEVDPYIEPNPIR
jgi:hypothetical protein